MAFPPKSECFHETDQCSEIPLSAGSRIIDTGLEPETGSSHNTLGKTLLVNTLNFYHFKNRIIRVNFAHTLKGSGFFLDAQPQPCSGKYLVCLWSNPENLPGFISNYIPENISFTESNRLIQAKIHLRAISARGICIRLPDRAQILSQRKNLRHKCKDVSAQVIQNGLFFSGTLSDLSTSAFCILLEKKKNAPEIWLNENQALTLVLESNGSVVYSGQCTILEKITREKNHCLILKPVADNIQRFSPRAYRSRRIPFLPSPSVMFSHPLTGERINLKAEDISGAGLSVIDSENLSALIPGLIIDEMSICFASAFHLKCRVQVIYRKNIDTPEIKKFTKCGIAFLDMAPNEHVKLLSLLHQIQNKNAYLCNEVNPDELWTFFFETGFIYPRKYAFIRQYKPSIRKTYEKLYSGRPEIARHFTWQKNSQIIAHVAMLRFYRNTWLIHHLASRTEKGLGTGARIIDQLGTFAYDTHRLASAHMTYVICYYRPSNRFPAHFFGGVAKKIGNPKACSTDRFAYCHLRLGDRATALPEKWSMGPAENHDLQELEESYTRNSDGLMLKALDLVSPLNPEQEDELNSLYHKAQLKKKRRIFALRHKGITKSIIMANISDPAVNLSDLTNCISVFVTDESTPFYLLKKALCRIKNLYENNRMPVLVYPLAYAGNAGIACDRIYEFWALDVACSDDFFRHYKMLKKGS
jgi:hypothetical protein